MGFFSDLKDDLSQAVNELLPEEQGAEAAPAAEPEAQATEATPSLDEMLAQIDAIQTEQSDTSKEEAKQAEPVAIKDNRGEKRIMDSITSRVAADETSTITAGMVITGDVSSEGSMDICGTINGNIDILGKLNVTGYITGNSKAAEVNAESAKINGEVVSEGSVKVGASSVIIGNISATSAVIAGAVKGDIDVRGPVILDTSAIVMGNIRSKSVQINNGAVIEGMCSQCYADVSPTSFFDDYRPDSKKAKKN